MIEPLEIVGELEAIRMLLNEVHVDIYDVCRQLPSSDEKKRLLEKVTELLRAEDVCYEAETVLRGIRNDDSVRGARRSKRRDA